MSKPSSPATENAAPERDGASPEVGKPSEVEVVKAGEDVRADDSSPALPLDGGSPA
jgi:hypothetical protein